MITPTANELSYGLIELDPNGIIVKANNDGKKILLKDGSINNNNLFNNIRNSEIKAKLHECFMGKSNEFIATIDSHPHFFLFHRLYIEEKLIKIYIYIMNINLLQNHFENNNWNNHLLSSVGEMAAGIAHEVRNPLTAVKGFLQLMDQSYNEEYSQIAQTELDRAIHILNDLMSVSKPEFFQEKQISFNVCSEIESILLLFQNQLYNINVIIKFERDNGIIFGRKDQIKKALFNLIKNAIEAMPDGGTLMIEQSEDYQGIHLNISDSGIGIPKDKLRFIGTPFFTLKQDGKGMGLAQVFNAIQSNRGKIRISSEEGKGTTFFLTFTKPQFSENFLGGHSMAPTTDISTELSQYLQQNIKLFTLEWLEIIKTSKSHIHTQVSESGEIEYYKEKGNPIFVIVSKNIDEIRTEKILDIARERGVRSGKTELPIHLAWELFQTSRGILWEAIKDFYLQKQYQLNTDELFALERKVNNIIDLYIDSYTAYYVNYKEELLKSHRETVDELSVPIIPISEKMCILPIVGNVDTYRAKKIREKTLVRVSQLKSQQLIIDISGVPFVDTAVVNHLFKIVRGIKLLGCSTILTGISPEIADTMIELGIEVDDELITKSTLQQALQDLQLFGKVKRT